MKACVLPSRTVMILRLSKSCAMKLIFISWLKQSLPWLFQRPSHNLRKTRKIMFKVKVIELANNSWSWNGQLMGNIGHRSFFNQLLSNLLVDDARYLVIFLDEGSLSDRHFWTLIALKTTLSKKNSSRHASRSKVRDLRRFLKVIFLHLTSTVRTGWDIVFQSSDDFFVGIPIDERKSVNLGCFYLYQIRRYAILEELTMHIPVQPHEHRFSKWFVPRC